MFLKLASVASKACLGRGSTRQRVAPRCKHVGLGPGSDLVPPSMRVCAVTVLAALALAEPSPWRERERGLARARPLHDLFDDAPPPHDKERRRARAWTKRTPHIPTEIASQMMLRAARSARPYDVPQIALQFSECRGSH
ncbi:unnamed protein product [Plutella xylostella]|uniref:(diamondback moth) hypothetical protein n=1 Tax=Plutella xylostella TaxID=51655 RepID=A0A8S4FZ16_PLUXY|nr:unnamed protein product [Plutella xylostella]